MKKVHRIVPIILIAVLSCIAQPVAAMPLCAWLLGSDMPLISTKDFFGANDFDVYGMLSKKESLHEQISSLHVRSDIRNHLLKMGSYSHLAAHYARLLRDGDDTVEGRFAETLIQSEDLIPRDSSTASHIILVEGLDTAMWWTFSPYLLFLLQERGVVGREAIKQLVCWANTATVESENVSLEGLRDFPKSYILDVNPEHITHRFTYQQANRVLSSSSCFN